MRSRRLAAPHPSSLRDLAFARLSISSPALRYNSPQIMRRVVPPTVLFETYSLSYKRLQNVRPKSSLDFASTFDCCHMSMR